MVVSRVLFLLSLCSCALSTVSVVDNTRNVTYQGSVENGIEQFLNIRFGEDTSGERRFAHPKPFYYERDSVVNVTSPGAACPQDKVPSFSGFSPFSNISEISEDCLNLRIARLEDTTANEKLPVMVWIYGGADELGQAYDDLYDPTYLVLGAASKEMPAIYVAMNYRVNVFGFANTAALAKEGSLNSGLLDQRLALEWVQENIAHFGGDPSSVTIFGESDGATGVGLQITAYGGKGTVPFQRGIMQSGSPSADSGASGNGTAQTTGLIASSLNCTDSSPDLTLACLRKLPMSVLLEETLKVISASHETSAQDVFYPTVDGGFLPDAPSTLVRTGRFHKNIPVIVGWNHDDGSIFADPSLNDTAAFISAQWPTVSNVGIKTLQRLYPISEFTELATAFNLTPEYFQSTRILRDIFFTCPGVSFAYNVARHGSASYLYELNQTAFGGIFEELGAPFFGVAHGSDIGYVFNSASEVQDDDSTRILANQVSGSWASFGNKGIPWRMEPVGETLPKWPAAFGDVWARNSSQFIIQVIGGPDAGMVQGEDSLVKRCEYINSQSFSSQIQT